MWMPEHIIILAGRRRGSREIVQLAGATHKALIPMFGVTMLERVSAAVRSALPNSTQIFVIDSIPMVEEIRTELSAQGPVVVMEPAASPCLSVVRTLSTYALSSEVLVVTADHPLLTPEMIRYFLEHMPENADAGVAVAQEELVARHFGTKRTFWRFRDGAVTGCNMFLLGTRKGRELIGFWQSVEDDRKRPWRIVRKIGIGALLAYRFKWLSLKGALQLLGRRIGQTRICAVEMPYPEAAIDVDRLEDLTLVFRILRERAP